MLLSSSYSVSAKWLVAAGHHLQGATATSFCSSCIRSPWHSALQLRLPKSLRYVLSLTKHATLIRALDVSIIFEELHSYQCSLFLFLTPRRRDSLSCLSLHSTWLAAADAAAWDDKDSHGPAYQSGVSSFPFLDRLGEPNRDPNLNLGLSCSSETPSCRTKTRKSRTGNEAKAVYRHNTLSFVAEDAGCCWCEEKD